MTKGLALPIETAEVFEPLLETARYKAAYGGRGSGKSHFFAESLVEDHVLIPSLRSVCIREVQKSLRESAKRLIDDKIIKHELYKHDFRSTRDFIETPGGGIIIFQGMQNQNETSIKSLEGFDRAWCEESETMSASSLKLLRPTIRKPGSQLWFSWNPRRKTDPVDMFFKGKERPSDYISVEANWYNNPWFTPELEQERQDDLRINPDQYDHIWEGGYVSSALGAYFAKVISLAKLENRICAVPVDPLMATYAFFDIGGTGAKADACAIWIVQFVGKEIRVVDYYEAVGQELADHVEWLRENNYDKAKIYLPHDGVRHDSVFRVSFESELKKAGFHVTVIPNAGAGAANQRIEAVRRIFNQVFIDKTRCESGIEALGWYHEKRDESRGIGLGPDHDWSSHGADAFGAMALESENLTRLRSGRNTKIRRPPPRAGGWLSN